MGATGGGGWLVNNQDKVGRVKFDSTGGGGIFPDKTEQIENRPVKCEGIGGVDIGSFDKKKGENATETLDSLEQERTSAEVTIH